MAARQVPRLDSETDGGLEDVDGGSEDADGGFGGVAGFGDIGRLGSVL